MRHNNKKFLSGKNIIYIFVAVFLTVLLFSVAAMCNTCGTNWNTTEADSKKIDVDMAIEDSGDISSSTTQNGDNDKKNNNDEINNGDEDDDIKGEDNSKKSVPQISLSIYEGPLYSVADDVCYYRVEAKVEGKPTPIIEWSKDDSNCAWGRYKAQVNLTRDAPAYTLKATASNSEGTATGTIDLIWGCNVKDDINEPEIITVNIPVYSEHTGYYLDPPDPAISSIYREGGCVFIGDAPSVWGCPIAAPVTGFLTYDFPSLAGKRIKEATIEFKLKEQLGDTSIFNNLIVMESDGVEWRTVQVIQESCNGNFTLNPPGFTEFIQKKVDENVLGLELKCLFDPYVTNNDALWDGWEYDQSDIILKIKYFE